MRKYLPVVVGTHYDESWLVPIIYKSGYFGYFVIVRKGETDDFRFVL